MPRDRNATTSNSASGVPEVGMSGIHPPLAGPGGISPALFFLAGTLSCFPGNRTTVCLLKKKKIFVTGTQQRKNDFFFLATEGFAIWRLLLAVNVYCQVSIYNVNLNYSLWSVANLIEKISYGCLYFLIVSIAFSLLCIG